MSAISNGRIVSIVPGLVPGTKRIRFDKTPPISTYMLALAIGEFDCLNDRSGGVQIRFCAQPEKVALGRYAIAAAKKSFEFFEDYTGVDYPFDKLDLVAVPDLSPGGMENPGAIFFREGTVLVDAEKTPLETRRWVATLITHEVSHMWVGDLVTARWWDDLWLNEGLGTWLARKALVATQPELEPGVGIAFSTLRALELDGLEGSRATRTPVDDPAAVVELFDGITNEKPASAMAMAESIAGEDGRCAARSARTSSAGRGARRRPTISSRASNRSSAAPALRRSAISSPVRDTRRSRSRRDAGRGASSSPSRSGRCGSR